MKRIRYVKQPDGTLVSMRVYKGLHGMEYKTLLSSDGKTGSVILAMNGKSVTDVIGTSPHKTKIALKDALLSMGVDFTEETRDNGKT